MAEDKAVQVSEAPVNAVGVPVITFTREQVDLIKRTVAKDTTDDELALFLYQAKRTGLDPLAGQVHCVKRNTKDGPKMSIQTAIDGYRLIADRTGKYAGNDDPVFDDEANPRKATTTVYKVVEGMRVGFTASARWEQYYPGDAQGFMWKKMPHLMLGKCAEALALRKAFPAELSGVYTHEEMAQAESGSLDAAKPAIQQPKPKQQTPANLATQVAVVHITKVTSKAAGSKTVYLLEASDGKTYQAWSKSVSDQAEAVAGTSTQVEIAYTAKEWTTGRYNFDILEIKVQPEVAEA